jgi:hypothetical protein
LGWVPAAICILLWETRRLVFFLLFAGSVPDLAYLVYLDQPDLGRWSVILVLAALLVYSNYYGWAVIGCLIVDAWRSENRVQTLKFTLVTLSVLALIYIPMWQVFVRN